MGAKKSKAEAAEQPSENEAGSPLASPAGRAWLAGELAAAEREERLGPGGRGWANNEPKRAGIVERAEFLRALNALVSPSEGAE
jgi:hypothetical protein